MARFEDPWTPIFSKLSFAHFPGSSLVMLQGGKLWDYRKADTSRKGRKAFFIVSVLASAVDIPGHPFLIF
jgi:hypothetical protein